MWTMTQVKTLFLLPLLILIGFEATLFLNSPYAWKLGGCPSAGLGACFPVTYDGSNFVLDMVFWTLFGYWSIIFGVGAHQRLFHTASSERLWKKEMLKGRFKMALLGGLLMLATPLLALPSAVTAKSGTVCLVPSPCSIREDQLIAGWNLTMSLWKYAILLVVLVSLLGVVEDRWHRLLGVSLIGISGLYLGGMEAFFSTGAYSLFGLGRAIIAGIALIFGPVLVLWGGSLAIVSRSLGTESASLTLAR
jgi:hypothetical protein